jgi:hypothetical protein
LASNRDDRNNSKIWIKAQSNVKQDNRGTGVLQQLMRRLQNLRHVRAGAYLPTVQLPEFYPFKIYKPSNFPPVGLIFDALANASLCSIDSTVPTNLPTTLNPKTDSWRIFAVRNGVVSIRGITDSGNVPYAVRSGNSLLCDIAAVNDWDTAVQYFGTDGVSPFQDTHPVATQLPYDAQTTSIQTYPGIIDSYGGGQVLIYDGVGPPNGIFSIWIDSTIGIIRACSNGYLDFLYPASPDIIPVGYVSFQDIGNTVGYVQQMLFGNAIPNNSRGYFSATANPANAGDIKNGLLNYRGYWTVNSLSGQDFYDGDYVIDDSKVDETYYVAASSGGTATTQVELYGQYAYIGGANIESTSPANDLTNWVKIGTIKL